MEQTRHEWVLSLDADERLSPALQEELQRLCATGMQADAYYIARRAYFWPLDHAFWLVSGLQASTVPQEPSALARGEVHESVCVTGTVIFAR